MSENNTTKLKLDEFVDKLRNIENEIKLLNEDKKDLFDEYKEVFDPKVMREAIRSVKARIKLGDSVTQLDDIVDRLQNKYTV